MFSQIDLSSRNEIASRTAWPRPRHINFTVDKKKASRIVLRDAGNECCNLYILFIAGYGNATKKRNVNDKQLQPAPAAACSPCARGVFAAEHCAALWCGRDSLCGCLRNYIKGAVVALITIIKR